MDKVSRRSSRPRKRVKVGKPILFIVIAAVLVILTAGLVLATSTLPSAEIAFLSGADNQKSVQVIGANGGNGRVITPDPSLIYMPPVWSPDGGKIAFFFYPALGAADLSYGINIIDKDGRNPKRIVLGNAEAGSS